MVKLMDRFKKKRRALEGSLLGTAVGDALGLPWEGMSSRRIRKFGNKIERMALFNSKGMISDDTEHACMVAQALLASSGDPWKFGRSLAWRLRFWLLSLPAGIGLGTLRSILKLWMGFPPEKSGVFSAGNGPAMRSPIIGVAYSHDWPRCQELVAKSTRMTHRDPKALVGAFAVALAASFAAEDGLRCQSYFESLEEALVAREKGFLDLVEKALKSAEKQEEPALFADKMGLGKGVSGYIYHSIPVVLQAAFQFSQDFRQGLLSLIQCGGDTDTLGAIFGGIVGAQVGKEGIPKEWLDQIW
ncbi:MAG: ADP-ribosylglycohydrolase family protein, partial [Planctomycetota bacterium]